MVTLISKRDGVVGDQRTVAHLLAPFPNGEYAVTIESKEAWLRRQPRTRDQNALMWAFFTDIARLLNNAYGDTHWDAQTVHDYFCSVFAQEQATPCGNTWRRPLATSRMTKRAMSDFLQRAQAHLATEFGMVVPLPGDDDYNDFHNFTQL